MGNLCLFVPTLYTVPLSEHEFGHPTPQGTCGSRDKMGLNQLEPECGQLNVKKST